jgi:hypothetical protein
VRDIKQNITFKKGSGEEDTLKMITYYFDIPLDSNMLVNFLIVPFGVTSNTWKPESFLIQ